MTSREPLITLREEYTIPHRDYKMIKVFRQLEDTMEYVYILYLK